MIESAYLKHIGMILEVHDMQMTPRGEFVHRNTWLCAAKHFWRELQLILTTDSEDARTERLKQIRYEIEHDSQMSKTFHSSCFPEVPFAIINATWQCSGTVMWDIAMPMLELPPGQERARLWHAVDQEFHKLQAIWMSPGE